MSSALISAEITATCNALGDANKSTKYILGPHCKESAKDLIKYLRRDDETNSIRRQLGDTNIVHTDLIPIIVHFSENEELFDVILRLLVNLTTPAMILYHEEIPIDKVERQLYLQIISHLQKYKVAFANEEFWKILRTKLTSILNFPHAERTEEKSLVAERIIILIRNVLQIPTDSETERCTHDNPNSHDTVVYVLNQAGMLDILIYIAMTPEESHYYLHLLEIMMLLLKEQNPESLAKADRTRTATEKQKDEDELTRIREKETRERSERLMKYSSRHSRFGGTYVVKGVKGIGERDVLIHKPVDRIEDVTFDSKDKRPLRKFVRGSALRSGSTQEHRSPLSVRIVLRGFCEELRGAYNNLMRAVREMIARERAQQNDETYYFWAVAFFMAFNRYSEPFQVHLISETMAVNIFHFLQVQIDTWMSNMSIEKKKIALWSRRIHVGLKAYKEMIMTLLAMVSSKDEAVRRSADTIQSNIFYVLEYRELVQVLFHAYQETKFTREYLKDLLETTHVFLKMLEHSCKHRKLVVQKPGRSKKSKSKKKKSAGKHAKSTGANKQPPLTFTDEQWNEMSPQISAIICHPELTLPSTVPFDAASDLPMDEQRLGAMSRMKSLLKKGQFEMALSMLRSSREVWPENDVFGSMFCPPEEELLILREIYLTSVLQPKDIDGTPNAENAENQSEEEEEEEEDDEEEEAMGSSYTEHSFEFIDFMKKFLNPNVTKALSHLLEQYDENTDYTNHCLVKMMHRIAVDCKMPAMLYQASVFRVFQKLLTKEEPRLKELATFAKFIVRQFVATAARNSHIFMELLFWKNTKDAYEVEEGYGCYAPTGKGGGAMKGVWQEHEEDELKRLFMEHEINGEQQDKVDWILDNIINKDRTRKAVIKKLKDLYLITSTKDLRPSLRPPTNWSEEEEDQLRTLYLEVKDLHDPMSALRERMKHRRSKASILNKLLELDIISNKSQMFKKRQRKTNASSGFDNMGHHSSSSSSSSSSSESEDESPHHAGGGLTSASLIATVRSLLDSEHRSLVEWVKESLEETLADVDEDETDVPLVPVMTDTQEGMQQDAVLEMLAGLGLKRPRENMELYWRIPGVWNTNALKKRIDLLTKLLNNEDPSDLPPIETTVDTRRADYNSDSENDDRPSKNSREMDKKNASDKKKKKLEELRAKKRKEWKEKRERSRSERPSADDSESDFGDMEPVNRNGRKEVMESIDLNSDSNDNGDQNELSENSKNPLRNRSMNIDSDDSDVEDNVKKTAEKPKRKKKRVAVASDSSDDENDIYKRRNNEENNSDIDDNETQKTFNLKKKRSVLDSDDSESDVSQKKIQKKNKSVVDSDESDKDVSTNDIASLKKSKKKNKSVIDSDESDNDVSTNDIASQKKSKKKNKSVIDSDESDNDVSTNDIASQKKSKKKNKSVVDSDESDAKDISQKKHKKTRNALNSSDSENYSPVKSDSRRPLSDKRKKSVLDSESDDVDDDSIMQIDKAIKKATHINSEVDSNELSKNKTKQSKRQQISSDDDDSNGATVGPDSSKMERISEPVSQCMESHEISFKETITLDSELLRVSETNSERILARNDSDIVNSNIINTKSASGNNENENTDSLSQTNETQNHISESKTKDSQLIDSKETKRKAPKGKEDTSKKLVDDTKKQIEDHSEAENSSLLLNSQGEKAKRPSEIYPDEETDEVVVSKVKRRRVIVEDDDEDE